MYTSAVQYKSCDVSRYLFYFMPMLTVLMSTATFVSMCISFSGTDQTAYTTIQHWLNSELREYRI